jgi:anti-sigma-K factor RskA
LVEAHKEREIENRKRTATRLQTMIASLEQEIANLDASIVSELALSDVRKSSHFAYPISARTMDARRKNLKATVAALSDRLALSEV